MNLYEIFNTNPPEESVEEYPLGSGIYHISILEIKKLLYQKFHWWGTSNYKSTIILRGDDAVISSFLELDLIYKNADGEMSQHKFVGGFTFFASKYKPNDDYDGIAISECIKNASKNIGRFFGMFINPKKTSDILIPTTQQKKQQPTLDKAIKKIIKKQN